MRLHWPRNLRKCHYPIATLSTSTSATQFCTLAFDIVWGSLSESYTWKIWPGSSLDLNSLDLPESVDPMPTLSLQVLIPHPPFIWGCPTILHEEPFCICPWRKSKAQCVMPRWPNTRRRVNNHLPAPYHHKPLKLETSHFFLHGETSGSHWFDTVYHWNLIPCKAQIRIQRHFDRLLKYVILWPCQSSWNIPHYQSRNQGLRISGQFRTSRQ
jgi:hypothetical protein